MSRQQLTPSAAALDQDPEAILDSGFDSLLKSCRFLIFFHKIRYSLGEGLPPGVIF